ncbi:hypothetical protein SC127_01120, partial [Pantoea sp. T14]|uniref:hypothetical protein n=1 Tax=Pantoea sp. T14 TaxID=3085685 RepID=UPI002FC91C0B
MRYSGRKCLFLTRSFKKETVSNFIQRNTCQPGRTPYNAPPLTRQTGNGLAVQETQETGSPEKTSEKGVDSEGEK